MHVKAVKIKEDGIFVYYTFRANITSGTYITDRGKSRNKLEDVWGFCRFNKLTEEFELDKQKSHSYFTDGCWETIKVMTRLVYFKRNNQPFPEDFYIAVG